MAALTFPSSSPPLSWPLSDPHPNPDPNFLSPPNPEQHVYDFQPQILPPTEEEFEEHESSSVLSYLSAVSISSQNSIPNPSPDPNSVTNQSTKPDSVTARTPPFSIPTLLHVSFNQDFGCFAAGTDQGFRIYNCDPFREIFRRDFDHGIGVVEMLFRCNILAVVGGGPDPQYPLNKVMIWDDHQSRCIGDLSFRSEVRAVRLRRDRIAVVLEQKIFVYNFADLKLVHQIETMVNPKGLCALSQVSSSLVLVCPGLQKGQIRVEHYGSKRTKFIMAHDSRIACFALTQDGNLLATASTKGTLVRVFNTVDGTLLQEVRRGADRADIYSLAFSADAQWLAASSDKGTVHVFSLKVNHGTLGKESSQAVSGTELTSSSGPNPSSSLSFIRGVLPKYFSSKWSVAQFRLHEGFQYVVAFGHQEHTIVILGLDGSVYRCRFDPVNGGEMDQLEFYNFLKPEDLPVGDLKTGLPFGQIPALEDGDLKLFESRAITKYLSYKYKETGADLLRHNNIKEAAVVGVWLEVEAHQYNPAISSLVMESFLKPKFGATSDQEIITTQSEKLAKVLDVYEERLSQSKYLAGDRFTLADLHHLPFTYFLMLSEKASLITSRPHVKAWWEDISSRPSWKKVSADMKF